MWNQLDTQTGNKITETSAVIYCVFLLRKFDLILMCFLYLQIGSEFEEKVSNILYAYEEKEEKPSVSHGVLSVVFLSEGGGAGERKCSAKE